MRTRSVVAAAGFDWDGGFVNAAGTVLTPNQGTGTGNFLLLLFGQSFDLNGPLPYQTIQSGSSAVYLASQPVVAQGAPGATFRAPEPVAGGAAAALLALRALARARTTQ